VCERRSLRERKYFERERSCEKEKSLRERGVAWEENEFVCERRSLRERKEFERERSCVREKRVRA